MCAGRVRGVCGVCSGRVQGVCGVCAGCVRGVWGRGRGGEKVSLAALISGYLGKSGHLPRCSQFSSLRGFFSPRISLHVLCRDLDPILKCVFREMSSATSQELR